MGGNDRAQVLACLGAPPLEERLPDGGSVLIYNPATVEGRRAALKFEGVSLDPRGRVRQKHLPHMK